MQQLKDIMTRNVEVVSPHATVQNAAERMRMLDVGSIPVCEGDRMVGMITDRDIAIRSAAFGQDPKAAKVSDIMTPDVIYCFEDEPLEAVAEKMRRNQVRRIPVVDEQKHLVGILALADLAVFSGDVGMKGRLLEEVSQPTR